MPALEKDLASAHRIALAIDTSEKSKAEQLASTAHRAGAWVVKLGLEISSATSWQWCAEMAERNELDWVADAKIDDIPNTTAGIVKNLAKLSHPPVGITIHTNSGIDSMKAAQDVAGEAGITMLGVTHLTSVSEAETTRFYRFRRNTLVRRRMEALDEAGLGGFVCSALELRRVVQKNEQFARKFGMIPGTRSVGAAAHDQKNVATPEAAIAGGADLLVIGRQITGAEDPAKAFELLVTEIDRGLALRRAA